MTGSDNNDAELDYAYLAQVALRGVLRDVLKITQALGQPPGEHHFYIEFLTGAPGVQLPDHLRAQYPERMTIVLQHQFEDLFVDDHHFSVTLHFKEIPAALVIPYDAVTQFADPSVEFALQFPTDELEAAMTDDQDDQEDAPSAEVESLDQHREAESHRETSSTDDDDPEDDPNGGGSADVVSLDRFRKK